MKNVGTNTELCPEVTNNITSTPRKGNESDEVFDTSSLCYEDHFSLDPNFTSVDTARSSVDTSMERYTIIVDNALHLTCVTTKLLFFDKNQ